MTITFMVEDPASKFVRQEAKYFISLVVRYNTMDEWIEILNWLKENFGDVRDLTRGERWAIFNYTGHHHNATIRDFRLVFFDEKDFIAFKLRWS